MLAGILTVAALATLGSMAAAPAPAAKNEDCLACHSDQGLSQEPRPARGLEGWAAAGRETLSLTVAEGALAGSPHEGFSCTDCHTGISELPHGGRLPKVDCASCHDGQAADLASSSHAKGGPAGAYAPTCVNCHGAHAIRRAAESGSSVNGMSGVETCGACHGDSEKMDALGVKIANPLQNYLRSEHGKAVLKGTSSKVPGCWDCHGAHKILKSTDPASPVNKMRVPETCGSCHGRIREQYEGSIHGKALKSGDLESPSCTDCHGEHDIESSKRPTSTVYATNIAKTTCPQCHASVRLERRYKLPSERVASYQGSFHGLAGEFGETNVANCASCHGVHDILPSADRASSINPANLQATCGKCHPNANEAFSKTRIHENAAVSENRVLGFIRAFYIWMIALVVGGLALHNLLDYLKRYRDTIRMLKPVAAYVRMTLSERIQHLGLLVSFFLLAITGFALKYPYSFWAIPFRYIPGGFETRGYLHRIAAVVMIADSLYHLWYLFGTSRGRGFLRDMIPNLEDVRELRAQVGWYLGLSRKHARFGRFNYAEKMEYLALVWGTVVMVLTGLILWLKNWAAAVLPDWGYAASEMVHFYEAVLAFTTIIIWHLYAVFVHTDRAPFNPTWITGRMTRESMEHQHPRELEEIEERENA